jgi:hypothetical protein
MSPDDCHVCGEPLGDVDAHYPHDEGCRVVWDVDYDSGCDCATFPVHPDCCPQCA